MHYLLKFGYDGRRFTGYQRGNGAHSVEDSILGIMRRFGIADTMSSAARTDRGVSASGNVIFFSSDMGIEDVAGILNSKLQDMVFHSHARVQGDFRVRHSLLKHYRYLLLSEGMDADNLSTIMPMFIGTHDFSLFSRMDERSPIRTVDSVEVRKNGPFIEINVFGPNFLWNQIRSMVGFAVYYSTSEEHFPDPFGIEKKKWPLADPEPLVLMNIEYKDLVFSPVVKKKKLQIWKDRMMDVQLHATTLSDIYGQITGK